MKKAPQAVQSVKCSLILTTYNCLAVLELCLKSIARQTRLPDEVIIGDDGSGEDTRQLIEKIKENFPVPLHHVWQQDKGYRKTTIFNKAVLKSTGEYIIQIDGDVLLDKHFVADHLSSLETKAFIRGTRAMLTKEKTVEILNTRNINVTPFSKGVKHRNNALRIFPLRFLGARKERSSKSVRGSNLAFWKSDYILVNGYNNDFSEWGHDDEELASRFINIGLVKKIVKLCAVQYHLHHRILSNKNTPWQRELINKIKREKITFCENGYRQVSL